MSPITQLSAAQFYESIIFKWPLSIPEILISEIEKSFARLSRWRFILAWVLAFSCSRPKQLWWHPQRALKSRKISKFLKSEWRKDNSLEQCNLTGGRHNSLAISVFFKAPAWSNVLPFTHSVAKELDAIAEPQPNVLNFASIIFPSSSTLIWSFITSPQA